MPFEKAWCPCVQGLVPLTHWREGACPAPPLALPTIENLLRRMEARGGEKWDGGMSPSTLMSCPRQTLIKKLVPGLYWDPRSEVNMLRGTEKHEEMARNSPPGAYIEAWFPVEGKPMPMFLGMPVKGKVDFIKPDFSGIHDYKTHRATRGGTPWMLGKAVSDENVAQLNIYRLIVKQVLGKDPQELTIINMWDAPGRTLPDAPDLWDRETVREVKPSHWYQKVPVRDEAWIAAVKPFGAAYSIGEIFDMHRHAWARIREGVDVKEAVGELPMVGQMMFQGAGCDVLCPPGVRDVCFGIAAGR